jgi:hypothetical protein
MKRKIHIFSHSEKITTAQSFKKLKIKNFLVNFYNNKKQINFNKNDIILHVDPCNFICFDPLEETQIKGIYLIDTHRDFKSRLQISKMFDFVFVAQYLDAQKLKKYNKNTYWVPLGFDSTIKLKEKHKKIYQVGFVGKLNTFDKYSKERTNLISLVLKKYTSNIQKFVSTRKCYEIYKKSQFVINKSIGNDLNMRVFEAMGNGAVLITDKISNKLNALFKRNYHYLEYKDKHDCLNILQNFIEKRSKKKDEKLKKISSRAMDLVLKKHTYQERLNFIVQKMSAKKKLYKSFSKKTKLASLFFFHFYHCDLIFFYKFLIKNKNISLTFVFYFVMTIVKKIFRKYRYA